MKEVPPEIFALYFSAFSPHAIEYEGVIYPTVEHAYHCLRYSDPKVVKEILDARSPEIAWRLSQGHKATRSPEYLDENKKLALMSKLMRAKLQQHEDVRRALVETGEIPIIKRIVAGPPGDGFWDIGDDGRGENHVGKIWMILRAELKLLP